MKGYNKLALIALATLVAVVITGCSPVTNHHRIVDYQKNVFDDENKIVVQGDSYTYSTKKGKCIGNEADLKFASFSGMDTIFKITSDGQNDVVINFEAVITKGDFKVVLITPDDEVINILHGTKKGSETIALKEGTSRIKLVGKNANGKIRIKIVSEENVYIKTGGE